MATTCFAETAHKTMKERLADLKIQNYKGPVKVVAVMLDAPMTYVNNETVRTLVPKKAKEIFKAPKFNVLPYDDSQMEFKIYREENDMIYNQYVSKPLKRSDLQAMGNELDANYILLIRLTNGAPRVSAGLFSVSFKTSINCDVRLLDVSQAKYVANKNIVKDGKSTAVIAGIPSYDKAYNDALKKALDELTLDTLKL